DRVHFLPVPFTAEVARTYLPGRLDPADYPLLIGGGETGRGVAIATVAVPIVLAVNSRALEAEGNRDISQLMGAASARARPDRAMEVPGWRRFVPIKRRLPGDTGGDSGSARTQSTPQGTSQGAQHKEEVARQPPYSRQQPRESGGRRSEEQAGIGNSSGEKTDVSERIAKHREAVLRDFLPAREPL